MRGNYETAKRWQETFSRDVKDVQGDLLEFIPTHRYLNFLVMSLGRTKNDLVRIQFDDGSRTFVNPDSLVALPGEE